MRERKRKQERVERGKGNGRIRRKGEGVQWERKKSTN